MNHIATVRVMPANDDDKEYDRAISYEYSNEVYDELIGYCEKQSDIIDWKYEGNAFSIESKSKEAIIRLCELIQARIPDEKIGIEWDYWIDD